MFLHTFNLPLFVSRPLLKPLSSSACAAAAFRIYYTTNTELQKDYTVWILGEAMGAVAEAVAVTLCCCFPVFPRFWKHIQAKRRAQNGSTPSSRSYNLAVRTFGSGQSKGSGGSRYWDIDTNQTLKGDSEERIIGVPKGVAV